MDLSFPRFEQDSRVTGLPPDLAVLMVGVSARQAASPTAILHASLSPGPFSLGHLSLGGVAASLFAPAHGAFNAAVAAMFIRWKKE